MLTTTLILAALLEFSNRRLSADDEALPNNRPRVNHAGDSIRQAPRVLSPAESLAGRQIPDLNFKDLDENEVKLSDYRSKKLLVVAFTDIGCPLCQKYVPTLAQLAKDYQSRDIDFLFVYSNAGNSSKAVRRVVDERKFVGRSVLDASNAFAAAFRVTSTTEIFVLDSSRTVLYRGAVDDQFGLGYTLDEPRHKYLTFAVDQILDGKLPIISATTAPGCDLAIDSTEQVELDYHGRIERILQQHCVECHRETGVAPFPLNSYEQVVARREVIRRVVDSDLMPPWFATKPKEGTHTPWSNDRRLNAEDRSDLLKWLSGKLKEGDPAQAPLPRTYPEGWQIGIPDQIIQIPKPINVKATGTMPYEGVDVPLSFDDDRWVQAVEIMPTNPAVVHHVLVFARMPNERRPDEIGSFLAIYVPGNRVQAYPEGFAKKIPRGARLHFQIHYTPNGTATQDQTRLAINFAKEPPKHEVTVVALVNPRFAIPPRAENHKVEFTSGKLPEGTRVLALMPHMHLRGKAARYELIPQRGESELMLDVPRYDFNWQLFYRYAEPLSIPAGGKIRYTAWYDNSDKNPANPDPSKRVTWGNQTTDEMHLGYVEMYRE